MGQHALREVFVLKNVRIWFKKTDECKYISHLDLNRCMMRAIKKAKIPLWYTEGFNPHPFIVFTSALSLGISGLNESFDIKLLDDAEMTKEEIIDSMNNGLPKGIRITDVTEPVDKASEVAFASFSIKMYDDNGNAMNLINNFLSQDEILQEKKSKKGVNVINLKEYIKEINIQNLNGIILIDIILPAGNSQNINPLLILSAFEKYCNYKYHYDISRCNLLKTDLTKFE